jgi:hypothetical protein
MAGASLSRGRVLAEPTDGQIGDLQVVSVHHQHVLITQLLSVRAEGAKHPLSGYVSNARELNKGRSVRSGVASALRRRLPSTA